MSPSDSSRPVSPGSAAGITPSAGGTSVSVVGSGAGSGTPALELGGFSTSLDATASSARRLLLVASVVALPASSRASGRETIVRMQAGDYDPQYLPREPDRSRCPPGDGSVRHVAPPASLRVLHHDAQSPPPHIESSSAQSDMLAPAMAIIPPDRLESERLCLFAPSAPVRSRALTLPPLPLEYLHLEL